MIETIVNDEFS